MKTLTYQLRDLKKVTIEIGFEGENNRTQVRIDCGEVFNEYPNAAVSMKVQAPKGGIYPATVTREGNMILWTVRDCDVANKGNGEFQLTFTDGTTVDKSYVGRFHVDRSLKGSGTAPSGVQDWLENAEKVLEQVESAEIHQPMVGLDGYWYRWDQEAQQYVSTGTKAQGQNGKGIDHIAKTGTSGNVDTYTIYYTDGTESTYTVTNGEGGDVIDDNTPAANKTYSSNKIENELTPVKNAIQEVQEETGELIFTDNGLVNLYEPQDISQILDDQILKRGVPQSQYGSGNFVTDFIPVTGGKTIKLNYEPWGTAQAVWRAAEYASDKSYITYIDSTEHTLSANAAYIRLTVNKSEGDHSAAVNLAYINANLQITDGSTGESSRYLDREDATYMNDSTVRKSDGFFVDASQDEILVMWKMPGKNNKDVGIKMKTFTKNGAYSFSSFGTANNKTEYVGNKPSNYVEYMSTGEDHFSPFAVFAVNNIDGDYTDTTKYTGGFHRIEGVDTARRVSLDMYFDGRKISGFVGYCKTIDIVIVHAIQASNTFKDAGTGREVLQQTVRLHFENGKIDVETTVKALESIVIKEWFFIQGHHKSDGLGSSGLRYIGGDANRGINSMNSASNAGDKYARTMRFLSDTLQMDMTMDEYDVGRFQYDSQSYSCDVRAYTNYSKAYFEAVSQTGNNCALDENETITARGSYRFGIFE